MSADVVWGTGPARGAAAPGEFHRLTSGSFGRQVVSCGAIVDVDSTVHCDQAAGPQAKPSVGRVCQACADAPEIEPEVEPCLDCDAVRDPEIGCACDRSGDLEDQIERALGA